MNRLAVACFLLVFTPILDAGAANQPFTVVKDPQAITVAQVAITAMGGVQELLNYQDSLASGTLTVYGGSSQLIFPITLKSKGTQETRVEVQKQNGTNVRIVNQAQGAIERPNGTVLRLSISNILAERVSHIPLLSILAEYQNTNISVQYQGTANINGQNTSVIALSYIPTTDLNQGPIFASITQTLFYVNQSTGLIDKIQYTNYAENDSNDTQKVEVYFTNYQAVNGIVVPFHQTTFTDGKPDSDLILSTVTCNVGLSDTDFTIPQ